MEINDWSARARYYLRRPDRAWADARGNLVRVGRLCVPPGKLVNTLRAKLERGSERVRAQPRHLCLFVTDRCDLDCRWCLRNSPGAREIQHEQMPDMTPEVFARILARFSALEVVAFVGQGEPLLNPHLLEMMAEARRSRLTLLMTTNGIALDDARIAALIRLGLFRMHVSLKGKDADEFQRVTGRGADFFRRQVENVRRCVALKRELKSDMIVRLSYVVNRQELGSMLQVLALAEELGVDRLLFDNQIPFDDFEAAATCLFEDDPEARRAIDELKRRESTVNVDPPVLLRRQGFNFDCPGYHEILSIDAQGNVAGCMRDLAPSPAYGNVFRDADVMNTRHFRSTRRAFGARDLPARCRVCVEMSR